MVRKGFWCAISFMSGLFLANLFDIKLWWLFGLSVGTVCTIFALTFKNIRRYFIVCGSCFVLATAYCAAYTHFVYDKICSYDNKTVTFSGYIYDYNYIGHGQGFLTLKTKVGSHYTKISFLVSDDDYEYYDKVRVTGKVVKLKDNYNFLSEKNSFSGGVFLKGVGTAQVESQNENANVLFKHIRNYSDYVFSTLKQYGTSDDSGFLGAMICGDKSEIEPATKNMLYRSGIGHIFAVSGTHLVILTTFVGGLLGIFIKAKRIKAILMLFITWSFVIFAGMSISVIRSAVMMTLVYSGDLFLRKSDCANSLGIAGIILCLSEPYCVHSPALLMSFAAAFAAGAVSPFIIKKLELSGWKRRAFAPLITSCAVCVFIAPVCLIFFGGFSVLAPLLNILLIPLCTLALALCFLVAITGCVPFIASPLVWLASRLISVVLKVVEHCSKLKLLYVTGTNVSSILIITVICAAVILFVCSSRKISYSAAIFGIGTLGCVLCSNIFLLLSSDNVELFVFANKKSSVVALTYADKALIFDLDCSGKYADACERVLSNNGIRSVNAVFVKSEPYYTVGKYSAKLYPKADKYYSASELYVDVPNTTLLSDIQKVELDGAVVSKTDSGFEIILSDNVFKIYPERFCIGQDNYVTNGRSLHYSGKDNKVRSLDYELALTNYSW